MKLPVISVLLLVSLFTLTSCGGTGNKDYFALQIEGNDSDISDSWLQNALQTADGGMIAVGALKRKLWAIKFDRDGNIIWENTYGEAFWTDIGLYVLNDGAYAIAGAKGSGGAYFTVLETNGSIRSMHHFPDFYMGGSAQADNGVYLMGAVSDGSALIELDNSGNIIRSSFYNSLTELTELLELPNGELVLAGERGNIFSELGRVDLVLLKTDSKGELIDTSVYGNDSTGVFTAGLHLNEDQQIVLGGYTQFGTFMNPNNFDHPIKLVINQDLSIASAQEYTFNKEASIADAIPTADGGMLMTGKFRQTNDSWTQSHSALVKTDSNGAIQWAKRYEYNWRIHESDARSVVTTDRGYLMSGNFRETDGVYGFLVSVNSSGVIEGSGSNVEDITNGTVNSLSLAGYSDEGIFWQSYGQASYSESISASPSTSSVTRL